jgi:nucleotide-binding universal stress UspA family protein
MFTTILVPFDGSEIAEQALPFAQDLAMRYDSKLTLLRALRPINISNAYTPSYDFIQEEEAFALEFAKEYLENLAIGIQNDGIEVTTAVSRGTTAREILKFADQNVVDLIVMTARGQSVLTK